MAALNRVQLIGALGSNPAVHQSKQNTEFAVVSLATNEPVRQNEEWKTLTEWHNLVFFGKTAETAKKLSKGDQVFVEGKIRTNKWSDNENNGRTSINIVVTSVQIISRAGNKSNQQTEPEDIAKAHLQQMRDFTMEAEDSVPF